jgi:transcriptional regulator with XRE-family HTH domain
MKRKAGFKSDAFSKTFGHNLREVRKNKNLSLEKLEAVTDIAAFHIGRLERGDSSANARTIVKLCKGLKIQPNDLFKGLI